MAAHLTRCNLKGCEKCCISNAVDKAADVMLWNGSKVDGNVRGDCEEYEGTDCKGGGSNSDL
jgi:hypothetical protein